MFNRRSVLACAVAGFVSSTLPVFAADGLPYTDAAFKAAQASGKSILIDVSASWCPTCKVQAPIIKKLVGEARYKNVVVLSVDFDSQKDVLKALNASKQSTLIGFKGSKETRRSVGDTNPMSIEDLVESTL